MSIDMRKYAQFNTRVGASASRPPLVPRPFADAESLAFDRRGQAATAGLESGTAVLLDLAARVAAPEPDPEALRSLTRVAETARARLPEPARGYLEAVGPVTSSVVAPLEERRRQAGVAAVAGALTQQKAVLRRLALLGAPLSTLRAVAKGQIERLHADGLMAGDRAALERAWDEELAGNWLLGRLEKDADLPLAEQPGVGLLEPETLLHLEGVQRQRQAARRSEHLGAVLQGAVSGAVAGRAPSAEQTAVLEGDLPGLGQAAAQEAEDWHQKQDAILGLVARTPLLGKLKDFAGGGPLYRRLLVEQQRRAGVPEDALQVWDRTESDAAVAAVLALPDEEAPAAARSQALLDYARQHLAGLPAELRPLALAELTRRGLAPGDAAALGAIAGDLAARRDIAALATARGWARKGQAEDANTAPGLVQIADSGESVTDAVGEEESQDWSQTANQAVADWVQQELDALGIVPEDPRYSAVPDTMAILATGYDEASGRFTGDPPDAEAMRDVLRWLYVSQRSEEQRRTHPLSDQEKAAVSAIYAITAAAGIDPGFAAAERPLRVAAFQGLTADATLVASLGRWSTLTEDQKEATLNLAVDIVRKAYDLPKFDVRFKPLAGKNYANWRGSSSIGELGIMTIDPGKIPAKDAMGSLGILLHEIEHAYQQTLIRGLMAGDLPPNDPRYRQVELFALSQAFYATLTEGKRFANDDEYFNDPREFHAQRAWKSWKQYQQTRTVPPY